MVSSTSLDIPYFIDNYLWENLDWLKKIMTGNITSQYASNRFKTINGESILGDGDIAIQWGGPGIEPTVMTVDNSKLKIRKGTAAEHASLSIEDDTIYLVKVE